MKRLLLLFQIICWSILSVNGQNNNEEIRIIAIGAHPDDADIRFGGTAALFAEMGHKVKFLAITSGDAGHQNTGGGALARIRRNEANKAGEILGVEYEVLSNHDAELTPELHIRHDIIRKIREWEADIVVTHRSVDYHPDHRNTAILVQDAAYLVIVPNVVPDTPPLDTNPLFIYVEDHFQKPNPFKKDIAVIIDDVIEKKIDAMSAHNTQMFEWLPWTRGISLEEIPRDSQGKKKFLENELKRRFPEKKAFDEEGVQAIRKWYPSSSINRINHVEFFEICEYGRQPTDAEITKLFPMLKTKK